MIIISKYRKVQYMIQKRRWSLYLNENIKRNWLRAEKSRAKARILRKNREIGDKIEKKIGNLSREENLKLSNA